MNLVFSHAEPQSRRVFTSRPASRASRLFILFILSFCLKVLGTPVLFPLQSMFGGGLSGQPITLQAVNSLYSDGQNLYAGTLTTVPTTGGTNPIVQLAPNAYLLTITGVTTPARFVVPESTNVLSVVGLLTSGPVFYFGTNGFANLVVTNGLTLVTNTDGSLAVNGQPLTNTLGSAAFTAAASYDAAGAAAAATNGLVILMVTNWPPALVTNSLSGAGLTNVNGSYAPWTNLFSNLYDLANAGNTALMLSAANGGNLTSHAFEIDDPNVTVNYYYADTLSNGLPVWVSASPAYNPPPVNSLVTSSPYELSALPLGPVPAGFVTSTASNAAYAQSVATVQANNAVGNPAPGWRWYNYFGAGAGLPTELFVSTGNSPTNLAGSPVPVYADPATNCCVRDPSVIFYNSQFLLIYNRAPLTNNLLSLGDGVATSPDGFHFSLVGTINWTNTAAHQWAPEWFVDPTNGLHALVYLPGPADATETATWIGDFTNLSNLTNVSNVRPIPGVNGSDPYLVYTNGLYYLFTSAYEYVSTNLASGYTAVFTAPNKYAEGSVVANVNGTWWWIKSDNVGNDTYATSTNLTNWTATVAFPWPPQTTWSQATIPEQGDLGYYPGVIISYGGVTTNIAVSGGATLYITNGIVGAYR
jgi:hypothetical protein